MPTSELIHLVGVIGSALTLIGGVIWWFLKRHLNNLHREIKTLKEKNANLKLREEDLRRKLQQSDKTLSVYRDETAELRAKQGVLEGQRDEARAETIDYKQRLERAERQAEELEEQLHERVEKHEKDVGARDEQIRHL
jgi:chromosome segregation ATPase